MQLTQPTREVLKRISEPRGLEGHIGVSHLFRSVTMTLLRRLALIVSIVVTGSLALAAAANAAGGGGGLGAGSYTFTHTMALAQFGSLVTPNLAPQFMIQVDREHSDFRPNAGPHTVTDATTV